MEDWTEIEMGPKEAIDWIEGLEEEGKDFINQYERKALDVAKQALRDIEALKRILK